MKELNYISGFEEALDYMSDKLNSSLKRHEPCLSSDYKDVVNDMIIVVHELHLRLSKIKEEEESFFGFGEIDLFKDKEDDEETPEWVEKIMKVVSDMLPEDVDEVTVTVERRIKEED